MHRSNIAPDAPSQLAPVVVSTRPHLSQFTDNEKFREPPDIPNYLHTYYWWAYVHRNGPLIFDRQWLVNAILWGNYTRLRDVALNSLGASLPGRTLQIACVYGDLTEKLFRRVRKGDGHLDVVDVLPMQLVNLRAKLSQPDDVGMLLMDSAALGVPDATYDRAVLFFLLHEQPAGWRSQTLTEALRVVKPGGRIVIVDYARPTWWQPLRYLFGPVLRHLEPFAQDLWRQPISAWMPEPWVERKLTRRIFFGGLYQEISFDR